MVCEKVIGKLKDVDITGKTVEYVDIEWHEAFKKIHRKVTGQGREVGIRMDDSILTRGLFQDDVIYDADGICRRYHGQKARKICTAASGV